MTKKKADLSIEQWEFLAVFEAVDAPISLDVVGAVSPLPPSQLIEVLKWSDECALLKRTEEDVYQLSDNLPQKARESFSRINTKKRISYLLNQLNRLNLIDALSLEAHSSLVIRSGRKHGGQYEINLAKKLLEQSRHERALLFFEKGLNGLKSRLEQAKIAELFINCTLTFSDLSFALGREFITAYRFLEIAGPAAKQSGDLRASTLIDLHVGRLFYIGNRRHEAVELMKKAESVVRDLGDEDIRIRASEFLALYYYMQGRFNEAMTYFETGFQSFEDREGSYVANPSAPIFYGYCAAYLGQFHKAIGNLDSAWRRAKWEKNNAYAATLRASLGMILLLTKKEKEAIFHIKGALSEAEKHGNVLGWYFAKGYLAYHQYLKGNFQYACSMLKDVVTKAKQSNIIYQLSSPWFLEMIFDMMKEGYTFLLENELKESITLMVNDPSIHIRGVLLRLIAQLPETVIKNSKQLGISLDLVTKKMRNENFSSDHPETIKKALLKQSESCLKPTSDPVQLAKTRIELAQLELKSGNRKTAGNLARKARKGLSGFWEDYFPDGIRILLDEHSIKEPDNKTLETDAEQLFFTIADLAPSLSLDDFFYQMVTTINRLLRAEKGGLFWAEDGKINSLTMRVARNLSASDTRNPDFSKNMKAVHKCFKSGRPLILRSKPSGRKRKNYDIFSLICIPLKLQKNVCGVLYYDNSYLDDCFDFIEESLLAQLSDNLSVYIDRIKKIETMIKDAKTTPSKQIISGDASGRYHLIAKSQIMVKMLANADQIATSDSTVLIQGETGVGKELIAERLHAYSPRKNKPFIIIDPTTIPENLVESELFGYEKGAFTGADKQKQGKIELAHQGTLFIDEIGEMPKATQAKLLRVLQEKKLFRIGGSRPIHSDFRLLVATNRNLSEEVGKGNFREDLFYRVSTVPIQIPPLRERAEDILLLAHHFLSRNSKKYHYPDLHLTPEDEEALMNYHFPGNIRELINIIERAVILSKGEKPRLNLSPPKPKEAASPFADTPTMDELQKRYIGYILEKTEGRISGKGGAADILNMKRSTLYSRMDKLGISKK